MYRNKVKWSPVEIEYLSVNRNIISTNQLTIALGKSVNAIKNQLAVLDGKPPKTKSKNGRRSIIGRREDLQQFFRSTYEANIARLFNYIDITWEFEPQVFFFEGIKRGTLSYLPDFRIKAGDDEHWIETKGYLDQRGKVALKRFKKFYPEEFAKLITICDRPGSKTDIFLQELGAPVLYMKELIATWKDVIPNWE